MDNVRRRGIFVHFFALAWCIVSVGWAEQPSSFPEHGGSESPQPVSSRSETPQQESQRSAIDDLPAYPVFVRISETALSSRTTRQVDRQYGVDQRVLGTNVVGAGRVVGRVHSQTQMEDHIASFLMTFAGHAQTRATGVRGPARVHSRTESEFVCTRLVRFEPHEGFVAGPPVITARTRLTFEGFGSIRPGSFGRAIERIAQRRANAKHSEAEHIAAADVEHQICEGFERALDENLAKVNKRLNVGEFVNLLFGASTELLVAARSSEDCICFGLRTGGENELDLSEPTVPMRGRVELWVHPRMFGEEAARFLTDTNTSASARRLAISARQVIFRATLVLQEEPQIEDVAFENGWIVVVIE